MSVSPKRPSGPPLNALRALEAAARLQSFVGAAEELSVTAGAISQHVKRLETWVGAALFVRDAKGVKLTPAGKSLLPLLVGAFDQMGVAIRALQGIRPVCEIHIATMPSLAQLWLPERLTEIRRLFPDLKLSVTAMETPPNLQRELFDLSLFLRPPTGAETEIVLADDTIFPVCASAIAAHLKRPEALNSVPRLSDQTWAQDWDVWSDSCGIDLASHDGGSVYSLYSLAVEEAKSGAGVLMGHALLLDQALTSGALVRPLPQACRTGNKLILEHPEDRNPDPQFAALIQLLESTTSLGA